MYTSMHRYIYLYTTNLAMVREVCCGYASTITVIYINTYARMYTYVYMYAYIYIYIQPIWPWSVRSAAATPPPSL